MRPRQDRTLGVAGSRQVGVLWSDFPQGDAALTSARGSGRRAAWFTDVQDCFSLDQQSYLGAWKCTVFFVFILFLLLLGTCSGEVGRFKIQWKIALPGRLGLQGSGSQRNKILNPGIHLSIDHA